MYDKSNIFAKIIRKEIPAKIVFEDNEVLAFEDINKVAPIHILVVPKGENISFYDFSKNNEVADIGNFFKKVNLIINRLKLEKNGFRVIFNHGADANQTVPHFHVHIVGGKNLGGLIP